MLVIQLILAVFTIMFLAINIACHAESVGNSSIKAVVMFINVILTVLHVPYIIFLALTIAEKLYPL